MSIIARNRGKDKPKHRTDRPDAGHDADRRGWTSFEPLDFPAERFEAQEVGRYIERRARWNPAG